MVRRDSNMDKFSYLHILRNIVEPHTCETMTLNWIFMYDNDPEQTEKVVKNWLSKEKLVHDRPQS